MEHKAKLSRYRPEPKANMRHPNQRASAPLAIPTSWAKVAVLGVLSLGAAALLATAFRSHGPSSAIKVVVVPDLSGHERTGRDYFIQHCQTCHGENGGGSRTGPPLVHKIYEPSHHSDGAFVRAVRQGVTAHHWHFGNMPSLPAVTDAEIAPIIAYVRAVQRANGIK